TASSWRPSREATLIRAASRSFRLSMRSRGITASCSGMENRRHDQIDSARARAQAPIPDRAYGCAAEPGPKAKAARSTDRTKAAESSSASLTRRNRRTSAAVRRRMYSSGVCPRGGRTAMRPESGDSKATARPVGFTRRVLGSMGTRGSPKSEWVMVPVSSREALSGRAPMISLPSSGPKLTDDRVGLGHQLREPPDELFPVARRGLSRSRRTDRPAGLPVLEARRGSRHHRPRAPLARSALARAPREGLRAAGRGAAPPPPGEAVALDADGAALALRPALRDGHLPGVRDAAAGARMEAVDATGGEQDPRSGDLAR